MDTVYGTKKYFQSLSGASDIYRSSTCRAATNDYSYQNTLGRRSTLGAYYHMNKQPSYTNDHSINSHYGYNTWGIWRDGRNIAPSTFSSKTNHYPNKTKSFSIILTTAAFIVLLAVISIAGLALYFSSLKVNMEDPVMGFEGSFRIAKGDLFSTGLKYNHTTTFKQKIEFYKRFVERSLTDNGLQPIRVDVSGFGDGPLIRVSFRIFLDVRKLPHNIRSVEDYIKESLFLETTSAKSLYKSLRIDSESVEIKRIIDDRVVKSASLSRDMQSLPTSQSQLEKRLIKKGSPNGGQLLKTGSTLRPRTSSRPHSVDDEPDIDVENAPVIQGSFEGSFEITKTDADIARKKTSPTKAYSTLPAKTITPYSLRVKTKKPVVDKITMMPTTSSSSSSSSSSMSAFSSSTAKITAVTTTAKPRTAMTTITTSKTTTPSTLITQLRTTTSVKIDSTNPTTTISVPKLDANLFTSAPVLDTQPWKPIRGDVPEIGQAPTTTTTQTDSSPPNLSTSSSIASDTPQHRLGDDLSLPLLPESFDTFASGSFFGPGLRSPTDSNEESSNSMFYHSFTNPVLMHNADKIEQLGASRVKPHPLPVPLIDDVVVPEFKPMNSVFGTNDKIQFYIDAGDEKFEHLGGGVIVKKHDSEINAMRQNTTASPPEISTTKKQLFTTLIDSTRQPQPPPTPPANNPITHKSKGPENSSVSHKKTASMEEIESRIDADIDQLEITDEAKDEVTVKKPNFMNIKEIILSRNRESLENSTSTVTTAAAATTTTTVATTSTTNSPKISKPTIKITMPISSPTKRNRIRPSSQQTNLFDDSLLFPMHSKWEFINGSSPTSSSSSGSMRRVFNKTLQAWVSEDIDKTENLTLNDIKTRINNATNIQDISLIFDTLASKLGITPSMSTKVPPFSHNKFKHKPNTSKSPTTTTRTTTTTIATSPSTIRSTTTSSTTPLITTTTALKTLEIFGISSSSENYSEGIFRHDSIEGEAEIEVIDPTKYEEMLKSSQLPATSTTESATPLVTLLPVRSNSGIRTYKPPSIAQAIVQNKMASGDSVVVVGSGGGSAAGFVEGSLVDFNNGRHLPPAETVVKGGIEVTV